MMSNDSNENDHSHLSIFNSKSKSVCVEKFLSNDVRSNSSYQDLKNIVENVYENLQDIPNEHSLTNETTTTAVKPLLNLFHEFLLNFKIKTKNSSVRTKDVRKEFKIELLANTLIKNNNTFNLDEFFESEQKLNDCDDHIYENLRFDSMKHDNIILPDDDSVVNWLKNLTKNVYIYEDEDPIFYVKRVPSKIHFFNCCSELNFNYNQQQKMYGIQSEDLTTNELEFAKLVSSSDYSNNECEAFLSDERDFIDGWDSLTYCDSETDLLGGLLEIFDSYFCEHSDIKQPIPLLPNLIENQTVLHLQTTKSQEHTFKFTNYILSSVSLNKIVIYYDKCLKFYFKNYCFVERRKFRINSVKFNPKQQAKRNLRFLDNNTMENMDSVKDEIEKEINDKSVVKSVVENNYEKLWETVGSCEKNQEEEDEHIYVALTPICSVDIDENEWEIDSEFSFQKVNSGYNNDFGESNGMRPICILYSDEDSNQNQIVYNYDSSQSIFQYDSENYIPCDNKEPLSSREEQNHQQPTTENNICLESVVSWKKLLRHVYYCDDEEDVIMTEKVIPIVYQFTDLELEKCFELQKEFSDTQSILSNESSASTLTSFSKPKDTISLFSTKHANFNVIPLNSDDGSRTINGSGLYKHISDTDLRHSHNLNVPIDGEPKKERERFRDKMKAKFKIKSSKTSLNENEESAKQLTKEEDFEKYLVFGCDLDRVEKDHPNYPYIPRLVKECIELLNQEENIKTPGIYRASGNKMCIESIKKKINEKKYSKKESKYSILLNQDIHTLTGILKMYFRELKPSLIPSETFCKLCERDNITTEGIKNLLNAMPSNNLCTLKFLMNHLKLVEKNKNDNMMNATNLAIVWGVCIFSTSFDSLKDFYHNDISKSNMLFKNLLDNYDAIFTTDFETNCD